MNRARGRRLLTRVLVIGAPLATLGVGWALALVFVSPSQVAANTAAPEDTHVWAEVTVSRLTSTMAASGQLQSEGLAVVDLSAFAGRSVTAAYAEAGGSIAAGTPVVELNGRPLIALPGDFPYYRDISEGMSGPDVEQLQRGLNAAGASLEEDGVCGAQTIKALEKLYKDAGYDPPTVVVESETTAADSNVGDEATGGDVTEEGSGAEVPSTVTTKATVMSMDEVIVVPTGDFAVVSAPVYGDVIGDDTVIELSSGGAAVVVPKTSIQGDVSIGDAADVIVGGETVTSQVSGEMDTMIDGDTVQVFVIELPDDAAGSEAAGTSVSVIITVEDLGEEHLVVPASSLAYGSGAEASVGVQAGDGSTVIVPVTVIATVDGRTAIEAENGDLSEGDKVLVAE